MIEAQTIVTEDLFKGQYRNNVNVLSRYPYIAKNIIPPDYKGNSNCQDKIVHGIKDMPEDIGGKIIVCSDVVRTEVILALLDKTNKETILWQKIPMILWYRSFEHFCDHLHLIDLELICKTERVVFLFGEEELSNYFMPSSIRPPDFHVAGEYSNIEAFEKLLNTIMSFKEKNYIDLRNRIENMYANATRESVAKKLEDKTAKIAVVTCRFSTAVQYYSRDVMDAFSDLGYETKFVIEPNDISFIGIEWIEDFKPDIVFVINYSSFEMGLPKGLMCLNWVQDNMDKFVTPQYVAKSSDMDMFLLMPFTQPDIVNNFKSKPCMPAPCGANPKIYKTYELTAEEIEKYGADICLISNYGTVDVPINDFIKMFGANIISKKIVPDLINKVYDDVYNERKDFHHPKQAVQMLSAALRKYGIKLEDNMIKKMAYYFNYLMLAYVYKVVPLMWLDDEITNGRLKGVTLKLWGNSWHTHPVLYKYSMGVAKNGETLSRILNASKISLGINAATTSHPRFAESFLSNSFCLYNSVPKDCNYGDLTQILDINEADYSFDSRNEMVSQIDKLLKNPTYRKHLISEMQSQIPDKFSFMSLAKNTVKFIIKGEHNNVQM